LFAVDAEGGAIAFFAELFLFAVLADARATATEIAYMFLFAVYAEA
tara:strand:+ start:470 stop:607 length:138 start_codon:yes stop_codon:yes gene_type:complete